MNIGIASDHHGVVEKEKIVKYLKDLGYNVVDYGPFVEEAVDYPKYAFMVGEAVRDKKIDFGILMCGTGIGMSIAANKVDTVRCARICNTDDARLCIEHNNANVIAFSFKTPFDIIIDMINVCLNTKPSTEERHIRRVNMINKYND